ncbi:MAG: N-acetyltransferase [Aureispira sp.]|nr:N-acetyltransferase [Aureispira sp.]
MRHHYHPSSYVHSQRIGNTTKIWQYVVVLPQAKIGEHCNICSHCFIENDVIIGDNVTIKNNVQIWDGVYIEANVFIGPNVTFTNDLYPRSKKHPEYFDRTTIQEGASIGANATILAGIKIGKNAMIGAGSVVTKNIPENTIWYGNPATIKGYVCTCGQKVKQRSHIPCSHCNFKQDS